MGYTNLGLEPWGYQVKSTDTDFILKKERITFNDFGKRVESLDLNVQLKETLHCIVQWGYWIRKTDGLMQHKTKSFGAAKSIKDKLAVRLAKRDTRFSRKDLSKCVKQLMELNYITDVEVLPYETKHDTTVKNPDMYEIIKVELNLKKIIDDGTTGGLF